MKIIAEIRFLTAEEGGRKAPVKSGYCSILSTDNGLSHWSYMITFTPEWLALGELRQAEISFLFPGGIKGLSIDMILPLYEGSKKIGEAKIKDIICDKK